MPYASVSCTARGNSPSSARPWWCSERNTTAFCISSSAISSPYSAVSCVFCSLDDFGLALPSAGVSTRHTSRIAPSNGELKSNTVTPARCPNRNNAPKMT